MPAGSPPRTLRLTLPLPPGVNNQYVTVGKRRVLSKPAQTFNREVAKAVERARRDGSIRLADEDALKSALLGVYLDFYFETPMRRDLDGGLKIALDALGRSFGFDDRAVVDLHLAKRLDPLRPRLELEIEAIDNWQFDREYVYLGAGDGQDAGQDGGRDPPAG